MPEATGRLGDAGAQNPVENGQKSQKKRQEFLNGSDSLGKLLDRASIHCWSQTPREGKDNETRPPLPADRLQGLEYANQSAANSARIFKQEARSDEGTKRACKKHAEKKLQKNK